MVKRYERSGGSAEGTIYMPESVCGGWVTYEEYAALEARLAELEKDAARYRWLRGNCQEVGDCYGAYGQLYFGTYGLGELDSEIDEAMSREA